MYLYLWILTGFIGGVETNSEQSRGDGDSEYLSIASYCTYSHSSIFELVLNIMFSLSTYLGSSELSLGGSLML